VLLTTTLQKSNFFPQIQNQGEKRVNDNALKLVILFDPETSGHQRAAHNLTAAEAVARFGSNEKARIIDQGQRHRTLDVLRCRGCKQAADQATREPSGPVTTRNESSESSTEEESENE
jgi:hypothetical protein